MSEPSPQPTSAGRRRYFLFPPPDDPGARLKMIAGLVGGIAISGIVWGLLLDRVNSWVVVGMIGAKVAIAVACMTQAKWRPLGQGLLASIAVGCWVFFLKLCGNVGG
jgi:hypothetical protein